MNEHRPPPRSAPPGHRALTAKVDAFGDDVLSRRASDMACRAGCCACCQDQLTVSDVEADLVREGTAAMTEEARARLRVRVGAASPTSPCLFLEAEGRCAVYASRPMVCRTQGLPLRYPEGVIPRAAIFDRTLGGEPITWCPLNFTLHAPAPSDVLDAGRVDRMLALSNRDAGGDPLRRTSLLALAREALVDR